VAVPKNRSRNEASYGPVPVPCPGVESSLVPVLQLNWEVLLMRGIFTLPITCLVICLLAPDLAGQSGPVPRKGAPVKKADQVESKTTQEPETRQESQDPADVLKLDTTLVVVPVIASDRNLIYVPDMRQEIVFFATIKEPFHVVLMLDTSASTKEKLRDIKQAARTFVEQLQPADLVKIISFDDQVRDLGEFSSDRTELRASIDRLQPGQGTKLYDAVDRALVALQYREGRKAIVLFTDGVDMTSETRHLEDNMRAVEESGVIVYPIRYDTRTETEAMLRQQSPIPGVPPTLPGGSPIPGDPRDNRDPRVIPVPPPVIVNRPPSRIPGDGAPGGTGRFPAERSPDRRMPDPSSPDTSRYPGAPGRRDDPTTVMLDRAYQIADEYLIELCLKTGGKLHRADTLISLPAAFARIAEELRTQYALGYYPKNTTRDGSYRKIQVRTTRKKVVIRTRPGYRARDGA
jgi:Mg-chelatase subunit ChlD